MRSSVANAVRGMCLYGCSCGAEMACRKRVENEASGTSPMRMGVCWSVDGTNQGRTSSMMLLVLWRATSGLSSTSRSRRGDGAVLTESAESELALGFVVSSSRPLSRLFSSMRSSMYLNGVSRGGALARGLGTIIGGTGSERNGAGVDLPLADLDLSIAPGISTIDGLARLTTVLARSAAGALDLAGMAAVAGGRLDLWPTAG